MSVASCATKQHLHESDDFGTVLLFSVAGVLELKKYSTSYRHVHSFVSNTYQASIPLLYKTRAVMQIEWNALAAVSFAASAKPSNAVCLCCENCGLCTTFRRCMYCRATVRT